MLYESVGHSSSQTSAFLIIAWAKIHSGLPVFKTQLELQEWVQLSCLVALLFEFQPLNKVALNTPNTRVENWVNEEITWPSSTPVAICSTHNGLELEQPSVFDVRPSLPPWYSRSHEKQCLSAFKVVVDLPHGPGQFGSVRKWAPKSLNADSLSS